MGSCKSIPFHILSQLVIKVHHMFVFKLRARSIQEQVNTFYFQTFLWNKKFKYLVHEDSNSLLVLISVICDKYMRTTCLLPLIITDGPNSNREYGYLFLAPVSCLNLFPVFACVILRDINLHNYFIFLKVFSFTLKVFCLPSLVYVTGQI